MGDREGTSKVIVTGGGGFVGRAVALKLRQAGHQVVALSRQIYPELEKYGIESRSCDLQSVSDNFNQYFAGCDAVFHVAAKVEMWGRYEEFYATNVIGTRNVIAACRAHSVPNLIYTSSPSVIASGKDLCGVDETTPYPEKHRAHYPATKMIAEKEVLAANSPELFTISLRPHLIFGPGDNNLVPTIIKRARQGRLVRIGSGLNKTDITFIDDCAAAHLMAWQALRVNPSCRGKAYFISQGEPVNMWEWINQILELNELPALKRKIPSYLAHVVALLAEGVTNFSPGKEPFLTRFLVEEMVGSHYFDISAAKRDLGYQPKYSVKQAMRLTFGQKE